MRRHFIHLSLIWVAFGLEEVLADALSEEHVGFDARVLPPDEFSTSVVNVPTTSPVSAKHVQVSATFATEYPLSRTTTGHPQEDRAANEAGDVHWGNRYIGDDARLFFGGDGTSRVKIDAQGEFNSVSVGAMPLENVDSQPGGRKSSPSVRQELSEATTLENAGTVQSTAEDGSREDADPRIFIQIEKAPALEGISAHSKKTNSFRNVNILRLPLLLGLTILAVSLAAEVVSKAQKASAAENAATSIEAPAASSIAVRTARVESDDSVLQGLGHRIDSYRDEDVFTDQAPVKDCGCSNCGKSTNDKGSRWDFARVKEIFLLPVVENAVDRFRGNKKPLNIESKEVASGLIEAASTVVTMIANARQEASEAKAPSVSNSNPTVSS